MQHKVYIFLTAALLSSLFVGCSSHKTSSSTSDNAFRRQPIKEVSEQQLATDSRLIDAVALQESGHTDEALSAYAATTQADPHCAAAWYAMCRLLLQRGWTDSARACIDRAVETDNSNLWYLKKLAEVQARQGDTKGKVRTWQRIADLQPEVVEHCYELANANIDAADYPAAIEALNRVERMIGISEPISLQKQRIWTAAGKPDKAEHEIEALADAMPHEKRYNAMLAELNMDRKRFSKAKQYYDRILAADPDDEYIHIQLAEFYKQTGKAKEADRELELAFNNPKLDCRTKVQILSSFYSSDEFYGSHSSTTFHLLESAMADCRDSAEFALLYGDVLMRQSKFPDAARQFELALSHDSSRFDVWEALLISLSMDPNRDDDMVRYASRAARLFPVHTLPHYILALADLRQEHFAEALPHLEAAKKWGFSNNYLEAECFALLAEAYYRTDQFDKAWQAFDHYLSLRPDDWSILNNYAYYLSEQGLRLDDALEMSRRTIEAEPDQPNSLDTYAWILHLLGRNAEALPFMKHALSLDADNPTLLRHFEAIKNALP